MSLSTSDKLKVELRGHTALVTIDNPGANTWDTESLPALKDLVGKLNDDKNIYALVLTGAGEKFFSAGADLKLFADGDPETARTMAQYFGEGFEAAFGGVLIDAASSLTFTASGDLSGSSAGANLAGSTSLTFTTTSTATASGGIPGATAAEIWGYELLPGISAGQMLIELWRMHGLDVSNPLTVTAIARNTGPISQTMEDSAGTVTVTRQ